MGTLSLDAEALYAELLGGVRQLLQPDTALVGIWSGGAWLAERLQADLKRAGPCGVISSALHRDDYSARGLAGGGDATRLPFAIDGARILLIDDVLFTGRTIRAVINELYDFGRPRAVDLRGRGGRTGIRYSWRCEAVSCASFKNRSRGLNVGIIAAKAGACGSWQSTQLLRIRGPRRKSQCPVMPPCAPWR